MRVFTIRGSLNQINAYSPLIPFRNVDEKNYKSLVQLVRSQQELQGVCLQDNRKIATALFIYCS